MNNCQHHNQTIRRLSTRIDESYASYLSNAWQDICDTITYNSGKSFGETTSILPFNYSTNIGYPTYFTLAPGGILYGMPYTENRIIKLDTNTDTITTFGDFSSSEGKWNGSVYHAGNGCIYSAPTNASGVLKFEVATETWTTLGTDSGYFGTMIAPNGYVYVIPGDNRYILKIHPYTDEITKIDTNNTTERKWTGGVLLPDGKIYCVARHYTKMLVIDTMTDTLSEVGSFTQNANNRYNSGIYTPSGHLYIYGYDVLDYNITTNTYSTKISNSVMMGGVGHNGVLYLLNRDGQNIRRIDTVTNSVLSTITRSCYYSVPILAPNGCMYATAAQYLNGKGILKISLNISDGRNFKESTLLSPYLNKY